MDRAERSRQAPLWLSVVSVTLIVAAVIAALAATQRLSLRGFGGASNNALSAPQYISTDSTAGLLNPQGAAFSPDGARLAVIGDFSPCHQLIPGLPRCGHGLAIYDGHTGKLMQASPIEPLLGVTIPDDSSRLARGSGGFVILTDLGWSPDSVWIAMVYTVFDTPVPTSPDNMLDSGLLLINPQTGATRVIRGDSGYFDSIEGSSPTRPIWHLSSGGETAGFTPAPGLIYSWSAAGLPTPTLPLRSPLDTLPATASVGYPVGLPDGGAPFTIWQPGLILGPGSTPNGGGRSEFVTSFVSWSSDGQNVGTFTLGLSLPTPMRAESVVSASQGTPVPSVLQPATLPATPPRDVALARVQEAVGQYGWALVGWNPAGDTLASVVCFARIGESLELRDAASGAVVGAAPLRLQPGDPGCADNATTNLTMTWAPDGSIVVLLDRTSSTLTLWRVRRAA